MNGGYKFQCICGKDYVDVNLLRFKCVNCGREIIIDWKVTYLEPSPNPRPPE